MNLRNDTDPREILRNQALGPHGPVTTSQFGLQVYIDTKYIDSKLCVFQVS